MSYQFISKLSSTLLWRVRKEMEKSADKIEEFEKVLLSSKEKFDVFAHMYKYENRFKLYQGYNGERIYMDISDTFPEEAKNAYSEYNDKKRTYNELTDNHKFYSRMFKDMFDSNDKLLPKHKTYP